MKYKDVFQIRLASGESLRRLIRRGERELEEGETAYATVVGSIEQFYVNNDAKAQI